MNIFKVLASAKKSFSEEQASALIAWLLNPYMEHGLGFTFLNKFLQKIDSENTNSENEIMKDLSKYLQPILRSEKTNNLEFSSDIEFYVEQPPSFIDIVIFINDILISIENKIYNESASDKGQLVRQYEGLKKKYDKNYKIVIIFLVPDSQHKLAIEEFEELKTRDNDTQKMITWDEICDIIQEILDEEQKCKISPINEYLRQTLKALSYFIQDDFEGYYYETKKNYGKNPLAAGWKTLDDIKQNENIKYIGVNKGIIGLLSLRNTDLEKNTFQYTEDAKQPNWKWLNRELFLKLCGYIKANRYDDLSWINELKSSLPADIIYGIAKNTNLPFYIGIQGGAKALSRMESDIIEKKRWSVSSEEESAQWIEKKEFIQIIESKNCVNFPT
ncbi:MAG: PD-(D/E)XK nuclease family protein [Fibromonadaceae bacterium]|jgi:hypothetical protein|nr:PD-(D/E)XK nuclease family protein [Fibromonadaceae bacterium]